MSDSVDSLLRFIESHHGIANKDNLATIVQQEFGLARDRSVYYSGRYAIRYSWTRSASFSNTVIGLSIIQKYDEIPFLVCQVTPKRNILYLANATLLRKVSHSSQALRIDNIRGSINGSDIMREYAGIANTPENFEELFAIHTEFSFGENLARLVEATNQIAPSGRKFQVSDSDAEIIFGAPGRAIDFIASAEYRQLKADLDRRLKRVRNEVLIAAYIDNRNIRGRIIEYLIVGDDESLRQDLIAALRRGAELPKFATANELGDYSRSFDQFQTATDVKTKLMILSSNPKAYNIDKLLEFLAQDKSVFLLYLVGIEPDASVNPVLAWVFQVDLLDSTMLLSHWAGRSSRGVTQFKGAALNQLIRSPDNRINLRDSKAFLRRLTDL